MATSSSGGDIGRQIGQVIERKRAEEALQKSVEDIHAVLDNVADGVVTTDEGGVIQSFNRAAQRLFGYPTNEVLGARPSCSWRSPTRGVHGLPQQPHAVGRDPASTSGSREMWGRRKDGSTFPIEFRATEMLLSGERRFVASCGTSPMSWSEGDARVWACTMSSRVAEPGLC